MKKDINIDVKQDETGKFCFYINGKRNGRTFKKLSSVKKLIKEMDKQLKQIDAPEPLNEEEDDVEEINLELEL